MTTSWFVAQCLLSHQVFFVILVLLAPLLLLSALFYSLKIAERVVVKIALGERHLSGIDDLFVPQDTQHFNSSAVFCLEHKGSLEEQLNLFRQAIWERLVNAKKANGELIYYRTRCYVRPGWFQYFFREDRSFKIENHVLKWEGEVPRSKEDLEAIVSKLSAEPLPERRSPWCIVCIPTNFGSNDIFFAIRISHALSDGISDMKFLTYQLPDDVIPPKQTQNSSTMNRILFLAKAMFLAPRFILKQLFASADRTLIHGPNLSGVKKIVWSEALDLELIKKIKSATDTTVNDVLLACMTMALRRYFQRKGVESPADLTALVAVNARPPTKELHFDNHATLIFTKMAVATGGILEQLYETQARMNEIKWSGLPIISLGMLFVSQEMCPRFLSTHLDTFMTKKASCAFSNLPGPQHMFTVKGSRMKSMMFFPPHKDNVGVLLSILSYAGQVIVGVHGDAAVLPDPEIIIKEFGNAVNEMAKCAPQKVAVA